MQTQTPGAHVCTPLHSLKAAERFIAGFEDDKDQDVGQLLADIRTALTGPVNGALAIAPKSYRTLTPTYSDGFEWASTCEAGWYRMRTQRKHGWRHEPLLTFVKASHWDHTGRIWECAYPAVTDDFGNLVEVNGRGGAA
ncbi:hypothetical protein [Acidovorax sp. Root402]|uniref:hypothetical protein n=1 Tax=Acidovorax sp. Root402 TaxID=1736527 RepID=UPI0006FF5426|nr:hypothetical protein [Acidovorax sp. Root402]KQW24696.1 hypothetical protein ASC83_11105 [Acidovorax sp. Root402]